jgi:hypothetical protein
MTFRNALLAISVLALAAMVLNAQETQKAGKGKAAAPAVGKEKGRAKAKGQGKGKGPAPVPAPRFFAPLAERLSSVDPTLHRDFPDTCLDGDGRAWTAYVEHAGTGDTLHLAKSEGATVVAVAPLSDPGVIHQPALTADGAGGVWAFWSQVNERDVMTLRARRHTEAGLGETVELSRLRGRGQQLRRRRDRYIGPRLGGLAGNSSRHLAHPSQILERGEGLVGDNRCLRRRGGWPLGATARLCRGQGVDRL